MFKQRMWHQEYPFVPVLLVFTGGIILQDSNIINIKDGILWIAFILCFVLGIIFHFKRSIGKKMYFMRRASLYFALFFSGILVHYYHNIQNNKKWYGHHTQSSTAIKLRVTGPSEPKTKTIRIPAEVEKILHSEKWEDAIGEILLYFYANDSLPDISPGDKIYIPNKLVELKDNGNPYNFQYAAYLKRNNLFHQTFLGHREVVIIPRSGSANSFVPGLRTNLLNSLHTNVADSTTRSIMAATLLNDRAMMDNELWQAYSVTGIAHIIAISGMHVTILFGILLFLLRWIRHKRLEWIKYFLAVPLVWLYIILTDFPPSAVRAAVMFTLLAASIQLNRQVNGINTLSITAFILLVYNPNWLYDTGVQLSFSAVLSIFIFYMPFKRLWTPSWKLLEYLWNIVAVSLAAQVLVFPLVIYYFHQFPVWVLLANIPASIYSLFIMIGSLLIFLLDAFSIPCLWLGNILTAMTNSFHAVIYFFAEYTPDYMRHLHIDDREFWTLTFIVCFISAYFFKKRIIHLFLGAGLLCILLLNFLIKDYFSLRQQSLVVYSISGNSVINYFEGKKHLTITSNTVVDPKTYQYNLFPTQLGYRAMKKMEATESSYYWLINGQKILYLPGHFKISGTAAFPVDYLILSDECSFNPDLWHQIFQPQKVILDGSFARWKAKKWKDELIEKGIPVHWVQEDGAWVLNVNQSRSTPLP